MPAANCVYGPAPPSSAWSELVERFGDRIGNDDAIYSLPLKLIRALRTHAPALLKPKDVTFERALRKAAGTGFRQRQPFGCPIIEAKHKDEVRNELFGDVRLDMMRQVRLSIHALTAFSGPMASTLPVGDRPATSSGADEVHGLRSIQREVEDDALTHQYGYAGWLLTNHEFHHDRCQLQAVWNDRSYLTSLYPTRETAESLMTIGRNNFPGNGAELHALSDLRADTVNFFNKWGLDGMLTWDIPIFSAPKQLMCNAIPAADPNSPGITLFIPWSLLGSRDLNLVKIVQYHQSRQDLSHLAGWIYDSRARKNEWGVRKYGHLVPLYVCLHLVLNRRYGDRMRGQTKAVDRAFAEYFSQTTPPKDARRWTVESIRKMRERMERRLCGESVDRRVRNQRG